MRQKILTILAASIMMAGCNIVPLNKFTTIDSSQVSLPSGYSIEEFDVLNENGTIYGSTFINQTDSNKKIVIMKTKLSTWKCGEELQLINDVNYCIKEFPTSNSIKIGMKWDGNENTFNLTSNDEKLTISELEKLARSFH